MVGVLLALLGCGDDGVSYSLGSSYDVQARDDLPAPGQPGTAGPSAVPGEVQPTTGPPAAEPAPYEGSLGPPTTMVEPVGVGPTTTTREGSGGPPMRPPGEPPMEPLPYEVEGPNADAWRRGPSPTPPSGD